MWHRPLLPALILLIAMIPLVPGCALENDSDAERLLSIRRDVGDSAAELLSSEHYTSLVVEIQAVQGFAPTPQALERLKTFLETRLNKPDGITIVSNADIAPPGATHYSIEDVARIEDKTRRHFPEGRKMAAYFLFLDGGSTEDTESFRILGHAYGNTSMALYEKSIRDLSGGLGEPSRETVESSVLLHEFGHILGLVNTGSPLQSSHQDTPHGHHCSNPDCLMYYTVNTSDFLANLLGGDVPELDSACLSDLRANGGR